MKPAVFLDRDGVLTVEKSYVCSVDELEIFPYAEECVKKIHKKGYYAIAVTNQSGIARGFFTEEILQEMNHQLIERTGIDAVYYCPHHPDGNIEKYAVSCRCRKPEIGLIEQACKDFLIDLSGSYMVGDRWSDIQLGKNAGIKTILLESGYGMKRLKKNIYPDSVEDDLKAFVRKL